MIYYEPRKWTGISHTTQHDTINNYISPSRMERGKVVYRIGVTYLPTYLPVYLFVGKKTTYINLKEDSRSLPSLLARGMNEW